MARWVAVLFFAFGCGVGDAAPARYERCGMEPDPCGSGLECHDWASGERVCMARCDELADCEEFGPSSYCARRGVCVDRCTDGSCPGDAVCSEEGLCAVEP